MSCEQVQDRLQAKVDGTLPAAEVQAMECHLAACGRCREIEALWRLMRLPLSDLAPPAPSDLTASILARTSGSTCGQAHALLGQRAVEALDRLDDDLLRAHVDACDACARLAAALTRLGEDLPALETLAPDARFVDDVLDATSRKPSRWRRSAARAAEVWQLLLGRPRLAWEAGYVGALVVWVVLGLGGSPVLAGALESVRVNPVEVLEEASRPLSQAGRETWVAASARGFESVREVEALLATSYERSRDALARMAADAGEFLQRSLFSDTDNSRSPS